MAVLDRMCHQRRTGSRFVIAIKISRDGTVTEMDDLCVCFFRIVVRDPSQDFLVQPRLFEDVPRLGGPHMKLESLRELFVEELKDLYSAENQIIKALPKMIKASSSEDLKTGFAKHLEQTKEHVSRLEKIFAELEESPKGKKCHGMEGLLEEGKELMEEDAEPEVLDAGLIAAAQHVEHYEIAGYGCVRTYAELLGKKGMAQLLQKTLDEEKQTDEKLTVLAEGINLEAEEAA